MRTIIPIPPNDVVPSPEAILNAQGIPRSRQNHDRTAALALDAIELFRTKANPQGILADITKEEFASVFYGEGRNESESPVGPIAEASRRCALFAVTTGEALCLEISKRFESHDFALATMLDAAASEGTELAAAYIERAFRERLDQTGEFNRREGILRFSPGYCGWHISAQRKLFGFLEPGEIGISLNESYLMQPLKSITGVIIVGEKKIFAFDDSFSFCGACAEHSCRERIQKLMAE